MAILNWIMSRLRGNKQDASDIKVEYEQMRMEQSEEEKKSDQLRKIFEYRRSIEKIAQNIKEILSDKEFEKLSSEIEQIFLPIIKYSCPAPSELYHRSGQGPKHLSSLKPVYGCVWFATCFGAADDNILYVHHIKGNNKRNLIIFESESLSCRHATLIRNAIKNHVDIDDERIRSLPFELRKNSDVVVRENEIFISTAIRILNIKGHGIDGFQYIENNSLAFIHETDVVMIENSSDSSGFLSS